MEKELTAFVKGKELVYLDLKAGIRNDGRLVYNQLVRYSSDRFKDESVRRILNNFLYQYIKLVVQIENKEDLECVASFNLNCEADDRENELNGRNILEDKTY